MRLSLLALSVLAVCGACGTAEVREASPKARVVPKAGDVWGRDLARGLALHPWELCHELGELDCIGDAHRITLGGVEPTRLGIDEPLEHPSASAPIAADRVALAACAARLERDKAGPAVLFGPVLDKDGPAARKKVAKDLVIRLLSRDATPPEVDALVELYDELEPLSASPRDDWAVGACVIVATSLEALFY